MTREAFWRILAVMMGAFCIVVMACCISGVIPEWNRELGGDVAIMSATFSWAFWTFGMEDLCGTW